LDLLDAVHQRHLHPVQDRVLAREYCNGAPGIATVEAHMRARTAGPLGLPAAVEGAMSTTGCGSAARVFAAFSKLRMTA